MYILGINAYHGGASACLIKDGELVGAVEEERFERVKYWAGFPVNAIKYCLTEAGISVHDVDHIGISRDPNANILRKAKHLIRRGPTSQLLLDRLRNRRVVGNISTVLCEHLNVNRRDLKANFHNVEHHRAHMASTFFVSPFENAAVLSIDGMGDFTSTMWGTGNGNQFDVSGSIHFPHSIGILYTAVSQWLGFNHYGDEGKVMGLAPYGEPHYVDKLRRILRVQADKTFEVDQTYLRYQAEGGTMSWTGGKPKIGRLYSNKFTKLFGDPRQPNETLTSYHNDIAASLQAITEEAEFALLEKLYTETGCDNLCMAGGVALNSVFNGKVLPNTDFNEIYIQPASSDAGTALGVCYYIYHQLLGFPRTYNMTHAYTGPQFSNGDVESALNRHSLEYSTLDLPVLVKDTAKLIEKGNVIGWFQGRMEWGPRALGNRSIIADPRHSSTQDLLNSRIKNRESFRPFAPAVLEEHVGDYFDQSYPDPFMLKVYGVLPDKRDIIPAVTHVDGSGRLQTVTSDSSLPYYELINAFYERTGVPVLLNTSFNENEPIVCTPEEAIACFMRTKMDVLVIGNYMVKK
ncbi:MAG: carbamoyltransferase [Anaerolineaceae bacterium]|nr:carbamoyltransferase [Anaerolineaceae bacterium]